MAAEVGAQIQGGNPRYRDVVCTLRRKDGREVLVAWMGYIEMRRAMRSFNMARDLTAIKEAEESARPRGAHPHGETLGPDARRPPSRDGRRERFDQ